VYYYTEVLTVVRLCIAQTVAAIFNVAVLYCVQAGITATTNDNEASNDQCQPLQQLLVDSVRNKLVNCVVCSYSVPL